MTSSSILHTHLLCFSALTMPLMPVGRLPVSAPPGPGPRSLFGAGPPKPVAAASVMTAPKPPDSSDDIHRLLENYSRQIAQTEREIDAIHQSHQQISEEYAAAAQALQDATAESQQTNEASSALAAEIHQIHMEINAKQANCSKIKLELASLKEEQRILSEAMNADRQIFAADCQELDRNLRSCLHARDKISPDK